MRAPGVLHRQVFRFAFPVSLSSRIRTAFGKARLIDRKMTELVLPSRIAAINDAAAATAEWIKSLGLDDDVAFGVDLAVREAVTNAVLHGNRQDEAKAVEVSLRSLPGAIEITVRDCGEGFDTESVPDPTDRQNILKTNGRGILFMRTFMDEVEWSRHPEGGTVVRLMKKR